MFVLHLAKIPPNADPMRFTGELTWAVQSLASYVELHWFFLKKFWLYKYLQTGGKKHSHLYALKIITSIYFSLVF